MNDKTLESIKNGEGLQPLNSTNNNSGQSGIAIEQRNANGDSNGITSLTFSNHDNSKSDG